MHGYDFYQINLYVLNKFHIYFAEYFEIWIIELNLNGYCLNCSESQSSGPGRTNLYGHQYYQD
jgi:hypothetical protein